VPATAQHAVDIANAGGVAITKAITVRSVSGEDYDRIIGYELGEMPEPVGTECGASGYEPGEVPF
jgi:DNA repair protein RadD